MALEPFVPTTLVTIELSTYAKNKHLDNVYSSSVNTELFIHEYNQQCIVRLIFESSDLSAAFLHETTPSKCLAHPLSTTCHPHLPLVALRKNELNESSTHAISFQSPSVKTSFTSLQKVFPINDGITYSKNHL